MLGADGFRAADNARPRRMAAPRPEGLLFAMASPVHAAADDFRWPSWLSPIRSHWDAPLRTSSSPAHRRSL